MQRVPARMGLYRFPFGACNAAGLAAAKAADVLPIQWDVALGDPDPNQTADRMVRAVLHRVRPGSIIIGHANGHGVHTAEALTRMIPALRERGYELVTVSELLAAGEPEVATTCYNSRPGDLDQYDNPLAQVANPERPTSNGPRKVGVAPAPKRTRRGT
jgi:peptidoglycan-N-acetylglucosamine deacetylase